MRLVFVIHNHQPVGNFEDVFEQAFEKAYLPFWDLFEEASHVSIGLHTSGPLLDFLQEKHANFIDRIAEQVQNGRVELLGGGLYEPILSIIPPDDARGQLTAMSDRLENLFGARPRGMWLAERVWEPDIPAILAGSGIEYTLVDDSVFAFSGIRADKCDGYWMTECRGNQLKVLPISMDLRYYFPFKTVPQVKEFLAAKQAENPDLTLTFGDDGEKFGIWPETHKWVYGKKWLDKFFQLLADESNWLQTIKPGDLISSEPPRGRVYLPQASYEEMLEWALPTDASLAFKEFKHSFEDKTTLDGIKQFLRGGIWANFLAKYPESDWLHKRMIQVSKQIAQSGLSDDIRADVNDHLYKAQCNCAYWHGLFGGVYLNYLRHALWENLLEAQKMAQMTGNRQPDSKTVHREDINLDGVDEHFLEDHRMFVAIVPAQGASVVEIDLKKWNFNITNVLTRREETFHREFLKHREKEEKTEGVKSIHNISRAKVEGLEDLLTFDDRQRLSFQDIISIKDSAGNPVDLDLKWSEIGDAEFLGTAEFTLDDTPISIRLKKKYGLETSVISCLYSLGTDYPGEITIATRFNLTLLAGHADDRYLAVHDKPLDPPYLDSRHSIEGSDEIELHDDWKEMKIILQTTPGVAGLDISPVITVSSSEDGLEPTYQGTCFEFTRQLILPQNEDATFRYLIREESKGENDD